MGLEPETEYKINATCFSDIAESEPTESITVKTTELPKITKISVPQRLDLYVDETKQLDVSTVPSEAMRAYGHVMKLSDDSIVNISDDKITGVNNNNNETLGKNYIKFSSSLKIISWLGYPSVVNEMSELSQKELFLSMDITRLVTDDFKDYKIYGNIRNNEKDNVSRSEICEVDFFGKKRVVLKFEPVEIKNGFDLTIQTNSPENKLVFEKLKLSDVESGWTPDFGINYAYTSANVTFDDDEKSSAEFDIYVHKRERMTSPTKADTANFIL